MTPWSDERVAMLRRLAEQGLSATAIGTAMDCGKNAVIGMCRRKQIRLLCSNNGGGGGRPKTPMPEPGTSKRKHARKEPLPVPVVVAPGPVLPPVRAKCCQWIETPGPPWVTCDAPVQGRSPYCAMHHPRVFARHREQVA